MSATKSILFGLSLLTAAELTLVERALADFNSLKNAAKSIPNAIQLNVPEIPSNVVIMDHTRNPSGFKGYTGIAATPAVDDSIAKIADDLGVMQWYVTPRGTILRYKSLPNGSIKLHTSTNDSLAYLQMVGKGIFDSTILKENHAPTVRSQFNEFSMPINGGRKFIGLASTLFDDVDSGDKQRLSYAGWTTDSAKALFQIVNDTLYVTPLDTGKTNLVLKAADPQADSVKMTIPITIGAPVTSVDDKVTNGVPNNFKVQNYPNPFNPSTNIAYTLETDGKVRFEIFDALGRLVETLIDERQKAGTHTINYNASNHNLSSGIYYGRCTVKGSDGSYKLSTVKLSLTK